jgi:hypothetical protein
MRRGKWLDLGAVLAWVVLCVGLFLAAMAGL